ncbi:Aquaporin-3 [Larimichthys crocea]|uniref:Uncharacterized protein n=1 Tax=Larimichthys crocea TaxID=215358 RepID=A0ACD3RG19_LARCR|nr:Aquaporin-3 [Larimichthys crocea]
MSVFDLFRGFFGVPGGHYHGRRDPFFDAMTHDEDDDDDDDEDGTYYDSFRGDPQDPFDSAWRFGFSVGPNGMKIQEPQAFGHVLREMEEIFSQFGRWEGHPESGHMGVPNNMLPPPQDRAEKVTLDDPKQDRHREPRNDEHPSHESPGFPSSPFHGWTPFSKFNDIWRKGPQEAPEEYKEDRDLDSAVSSGGLDQILTPPAGQAPNQPRTRSFFQSVTVTKVVKPDGTVEERRTVRDSQGKEETTVTRSGGPGTPEGPETGPVTPVRMSYRVNYSPLLRVHAQPSQPCHKVCDVAFGSCMKGQTLPSKSGSAVLCGSDPPDDGVPALKAHSWPDGVEESSGMERLLRKCQIRNQLVRECLAECLGVYVLILFGCGSVAQVTTTQDKKGQYLSINLGFALGVTFGVFVSRGVSGAHLNPAVSLSLCFLGRHSWIKLPFYIFFQVLGAFLAAATVGLQYYDAIQAYSGGELTVTGPTATAGIFSTYPADYLSVWGGVMDQVIGTAALLLCVLALGDQRNSSIPHYLQPVLVGAAVLVIGVSMGSNSGYALNPARDLGPRIFTFVAWLGS